MMMTTYSVYSYHYHHQHTHHYYHHHHNHHQHTHNIITIITLIILILTIGTSIALEVRAQEAVQTFRETAGPWDIDMAKVVIGVEWVKFTAVMRQMVSFDITFTLPYISSSIHSSHQQSSSPNITKYHPSLTAIITIIYHQQMPLSSL